MQQHPRRIADRYEVRPLDGGGMGTIWHGYDTVLDRQVAIKQIRGDRRHSAAMRRELVDRFRREARVTAKIEHPGVPVVYDAAIDRDVGEDGDADGVERLYLVLQLVDGVTVSDILAEHGPLPVPWAIAIAAQVCSVLSYAHAIPVVHRDLKPSNVMVDGGGYVKVLDFGVAAVLGTDVTRLTETGRVIGTRDYMSPEQFHGVGVSPRSDLYALGCLLHEMLAGTKLFDGARDPALKHVFDPPTPLRALRPEVNPAIERLVLDLLEKAPEDRPASSQVVLDRLSPFLPVPGAGTAAADSGAVVAEGIPDPTRPYRHPLAPRRPDTLRPGAPRQATPAPTPERHTGVALPASLVDRLDAAEQQVDALVGEERFSQAAGVLGDILDTVGARAIANNPELADHPRILESRISHAGLLFLGGDYGEALRAFQQLIPTLIRVLGPRDERVLECRRQAAFCQAELGDGEAALAELEALLELARQNAGERSSAVLELRRQIGILLLAGHRLGDAARVLRGLYSDLLAVRDSSDAEVGEVRDLLTRIRLTSTGEIESTPE